MKFVTQTKLVHVYCVCLRIFLDMFSKKKNIIKALYIISVWSATHLSIYYCIIWSVYQQYSYLYIFEQTVLQNFVKHSEEISALHVNTPMVIAKI